MFITGILAYAETFGNALVCDDHFLIGVDRLHIFGNGGLGWLSPPRWLFYGEYPIYLRPVTLGLMWLISVFAGVQAAPYHLVDVLLHAANAALIFLILRKLSISPAASALTGFLFVLTPVAPEAVSWPAGIVDTLPLFFILLSVYTYLGYLAGYKAFPYIVSLLAAAAALLSKEVAIPLIVLIPLADVLFAGRIGREGTGGYPRRGKASAGDATGLFTTARLRRLAPFALLLAAYVVVRFAVLGVLLGEGGHFGDSSPGEKLATLSVVLAPLNPMYVATYLVDFMQFYVGLLLVGAALMVAHRFRHIDSMTRRVLVFLAAVLLLPLAPVIGVVSAGIGTDLQWSHILYIPTLGMLALAAVGLIDCGWRNRAWTVTAVCALALLLPLFAWGLHQNNLFWSGVSARDESIVMGVHGLLPDPPPGATIYLLEEQPLVSSRMYWCKPMLEPALRAYYRRFDLDVRQLGGGNSPADAEGGYLFIYSGASGSLRLEHPPSIR